MRPPAAPPEEGPRPEASAREGREARLRVTIWMFGALAGFFLLGTAALLLWAALFSGGPAEVEEVRAAWPPKAPPGPLPGSRPIRWEGVELSLPERVVLTRGEGFLKVEFPGRCAPNLRRVAPEANECLSLTLRKAAPGEGPPAGEGRPLALGGLRASWRFGASWAPANYRVWELRVWVEGAGAHREVAARGHHLSAPPRRVFEVDIWPIFYSIRLSP